MLWRMDTARALLVALSLVAASACGGGSNGSNGAAKDGFVTAANAICADARQELLDISGSFAGDTPLEQIAAFLHDVYVPRLRTELADVRALGLPDADRAALDGIFDDYTNVLDDIEANPDQFASSGTDPFAELDARLTSQGLTSC